MTKVTPKDVVHVAKLAKLELDSSEIKKFTRELAEIVQYISQLSEVETKETQPTSQTTGLVNVLRKDEASVNEVLTQEEVTSGTENVKNGSFEVPGILDERAEK